MARSTASGAERSKTKSDPSLRLSKSTGNASSRSTGSCTSRAAPTTARSCSSASRRSSSRSPAPGHEALLVAAGLVLKPGYDWFFPYYRDRALCLALGVTVEELLLQAVGAAADPASGGRQMPSHWSSPQHCTSFRRRPPLPPSACTPSAAPRPDATSPAIPKPPKSTRATTAQWRDVAFHGDEVVLRLASAKAPPPRANSGKRSTLPRIRSCPSSSSLKTTATPSPCPSKSTLPAATSRKLVQNFPNFHFAEIDGTDPVACYRAFEEAAALCRSGNGPAFVHGHVIRPYSHSLSDDDSSYRPESERQRRRAARSALQDSDAACCAKAFSTPTASIGWKRKSTKKSARRRNGLCVLRFPSPTRPPS